MSIADFNNFSELIDAYYHGELDKSSIAELLKAIDQNVSLKAEFNALGKLHNTIQNDSAAFTPPETAFENINNILHAEKKAKAIKYAKKYGVPTAAAFILALLSLLYFNNDINNSSNNPAAKYQYNHNITVFNQQSHKSFDSGKKPHIAHVQSFENNAFADKSSKYYQNTKRMPSEAETKASLDRNNIIDDLKSAKSDNTVTDNNDNNIVSTNIGNHNYNSYERLTQSNYNFSYNSANWGNIHQAFNIQNIIGPKFNYDFSTSGKKTFAIEFRGLVSKNLPDNYESSKVQGSLNNFAIGFYTNMSSSDKIKFGLEFGKEAFNQRLSHNGTDNSQQNYRQSPVIFWGTVSMQMNLGSFEMLPDLNSFSRVMLGATELGPVAKALVGFDYRISNSGVNLILGLEGSFLPYQSNSVWYSSQKLGFTLGVSYDL